MCFFLYLYLGVRLHVPSGLIITDYTACFRSIMQYIEIHLGILIVMFNFLLIHLGL